MNIVGELKWHFNDKDFARLKFSESKEGFAIDIILVPAKYRNQGVGKKLLEHVLILADSMQKAINLTVRPIGSNLDPEALESLTDYYAKFGFIEHDRGATVVYMRRRPRQAKEKP